MSEPIFFQTGSAFRNWLAEHAATETELVVGFHQRGHAGVSVVGHAHFQRKT